MTKNPLRIHPQKITFILFFSFFVLSHAVTSSAEIRMISFDGYPVTLILGEEDKVITSAFLKSPSGIHEISALCDLSYAGMVSTQSKIEGENREGILWKLTFFDPDNQGNGLHLWVATILQAQQLWVASTPIAATRWDKIPTKLVVAKGTALYVSPQTPVYNDIQSFEGADVLSFVYTVRLTSDGPLFYPESNVYKQLLATVEMIKNSEYEPMKRQAYTRLLSEFKKLSTGNRPSTEVIRNFNWKKILTTEWQP